MAPKTKAASVYSPPLFWNGFCYFPRPEALGSRTDGGGAVGGGLAELPSSAVVAEAPGLGWPELRYCSKIFAACGESAGFFLLVDIVVTS